MSEVLVWDVRKIAVAVITQAVTDARTGQQEAINWFSTKAAADYLAVLDLEPETVIAMARAGFPKGKRQSGKPAKEITYQIGFELD